MSGDGVAGKGKVMGLGRGKVGRETCSPISSVVGLRRAVGAEEHVAADADADAGAGAVVVMAWRRWESLSSYLALSAGGEDKGEGEAGAADVMTAKCLET